MHLIWSPGRNSGLFLGFIVRIPEQVQQLYKSCCWNFTWTQTAGQQIRSKIDSFQNANFLLISQPNPMMLKYHSLESSRTHHRGHIIGFGWEMRKLSWKPFCSLFLNYSPDLTVRYITYLLIVTYRGFPTQVPGRDPLCWTQLGLSSCWFRFLHLNGLGSHTRLGFSRIHLICFRRSSAF